MHDWPSLRTEITLALLLAAACSSDDGDTTGAADSTGALTTTGNTGDTDSSGGSSAAETTSSSPDTGSSSGSDGGPGDSSGASTGGDQGMLYMIDASATPCFSLASGTANADNPCTSGDLYFLIGANVDLGDVGQMGWCSTGAAADLDAVPTDYAACAWQSYVEGIEGLANTGYIVRDATAAHHYRFQIVDNTAPVLQFHYDAID